MSCNLALNKKKMNSFVSKKKGAHYSIRIFTYKKYTPLNILLSTFEVESMDVIIRAVGM